METPPLLLGHRGTRANKAVPENTLAAFDLALAQGGDGFEFDVRLAADGQAVICHDATTTTGSFRIAETPSQQLNLPLLRDVLTRYQNTAFLDIELKVPGLETITADVLRQLPPGRGFVVSSFFPEVLEAINTLNPTIPLGLICENQDQFKHWPRLPIKYVIPHYKLMSNKLIPEVKDTGKKIFVWTVNTSADMKRFAQWGVDGIISDNPKQLALALRRQIQKP